MKNKAFWVSFIAFLAIALALNTVVASDFVTITNVEVNGIDASGSTVVAGDVSDTVPVEVEFTANADVSDVKVKIYTEGYKEDIQAYTELFHVINGSTYVKRFTVKLPSARDLDDLTEKLSLNVEVVAKGEDSVEKKYSVEMQRQLYNLNILSIDSADKATPGSTINVDVVVENNGNERLDNVYVRASIPELAVARTVYLGDLGPRPEGDNQYYDDIRDAVSKTLYLQLPKNANPGNYDLQVEVYNYDTSTTAKKKVAVEAVQSGIVPTVTSRSVTIGEETTFNVVLVNPNSRMVVYTIVPEQATGLTVEVSEPVVAVSADSSKTVQVKVKATGSAEEGAHLVTVNVNSEAGVERKVNFTLNVEKKAGTTGNVVTGVTGQSNTVLVLTVILVIIFVVLLIVLIVLLTRRPAETEEFGETSYY